MGVVGNLQAARKNISEAIDIALESQADCIHLWGDAEYSRAHHHRIKVHRWTSNKRVIYDTFDVLVNLSEQETFGMVVIEAMSAGLPCQLSSIPAFEQFRGCPGVRFIDEANREQAPQIVNELLQVKAVLKADIIAFWNSNFSEAAVADEWRMLIDEICDGYGG